MDGCPLGTNRRIIFRQSKKIKKLLFSETRSKIEAFKFYFVQINVELNVDALISLSSKLTTIRTT